MELAEISINIDGTQAEISINIDDLSRNQHKHRWN